MNLSFFAAAGGIALVDIVLSGDNALVIGAAAGKLPGRQRLLAILWGGAGAIVMRIVLAIIATELLTVRYLQAIGGVILFFVAIRILLPERESSRPNRTANRLLPAVATIMVADLTMSLDNVLAIGALAAGNSPLLVGGLAASMILLFVASTIIARLMDYFTWLLDAAAIVLAWTAANLVLEDPSVSGMLRIPDPQRFDLALHFGFVALILTMDLFIRAFTAHRASAEGHRGLGDGSEQDAPDEDRESHEERAAANSHVHHPHSHHDGASLDPAHLPHPHPDEPEATGERGPQAAVSPDSLRIQ